MPCQQRGWELHSPELRDGWLQNRSVIPGRDNRKRQSLPGQGGLKILSPSPRGFCSSAGSREAHAGHEQVLLAGFEKAAGISPRVSSPKISLRSQPGSALKTATTCPGSDPRLVLNTKPPHHPWGASPCLLMDPSAAMNPTRLERMLKGVCKNSSVGGGLGAELPQGDQPGWGLEAAAADPELWVLPITDPSHATGAHQSREAGMDRENCRECQHRSPVIPRGDDISPGRNATKAAIFAAIAHGVP